LELAAPCAALARNSARAISKSNPLRAACVRQVLPGASFAASKVIDCVEWRMSRSLSGDGLHWQSELGIVGNFGKKRFVW
jgi:hypothetical protein